MTTKSETTVWFERPGDTWFDGLPVGNGRTGAMSYGGFDRFALALNDETFWSPGPRVRDFSAAPGAFTSTRRLLANEDVIGAQSGAAGLMGTPTLGAAFQPIGSVVLEMPSAGRTSFRRSLDLTTGVASFEQSSADHTVVRRVVASREPSVFLVTQRGGTTPTLLSVSSPFPLSAADEGLWVGQWEEVAPNRDLVAGSYRLTGYEGGRRLRFAIGIRVLDGEHVLTEDGLSLTSGDWSLAIAVGTDLEDDLPVDTVRERLAACGDPGPLIAAAIEDHRSVFERASISLDTTGPEAAILGTLPTDSRVHLVRAGGIDDGLTLLLSDYGRYLLIASSVGGSYPPTLQGVWNEDTEPAWSSNWTLNINAQMNLWVADPFHLTEASDTLLTLVERLAEAGRRTAREIYGGGGWVVHHNSDIWTNTAPTTMVEVGFFPAAGLWMLQQLLIHHGRYPEREIADRLSDLLDGAIEFLRAWLIEDPAGSLITSPSSTPENAYLLGDTPRPRSRAMDPEYWRHGWLGEAPTLDMWLVRDTLTSAIRFAEAAGDASRSAELSSVLQRLRPITLQDGEIPEWTCPSRPLELGHRHLSSLYEVYPGPNDLPAEFRDAARTTLLRRQAGVESSSNGWGGWSRVWASAMWARLRDGERALASLESVIRTGIAPESLLHAFPEFDGHPAPDAVHQSDANMGFPAAVCEMLLQSSHDKIRLLPAVPARWRAGTVRNLRAHDGIDVSFRWHGSAVTECKLRSSRNCHVTVVTPSGRFPAHLVAGELQSLSFTGIPETTREGTAS